MGELAFDSNINSNLPESTRVELWPEHLINPNAYNINWKQINDICHLIEQIYGIQVRDVRLPPLISNL